MKIGFYSPRFLPQTGGLQLVCHAWAQALQQLGHQVVVVTHTPGTPPEGASYRIVRSRSWWQQWRALRSCAWVWMMDVSLPGLIPVLASGARIGFSHHTAFGAPDRPLPRRQALKRSISRWLPRVNICCSRFLAQAIPGAQVVPSPYRPDVFKNLGMPRQPQSLLFVGRLVSIKGLAVLLQAMVPLAKKGYRLAIAGEGPEAGPLQQQAREWGLEPYVDWLGNLSPDAVAHCMNQYEILVVPSLEEPLGTVVFEALACGMQVVASQTGGLPEAVDGFGRLVPPGDPMALVDAIMAMPVVHHPEALTAFLAQRSPEAGAEKLLKFADASTQS